MKNAYFCKQITPKKDKMAQTNIITGQYVRLNMTAASVLSRITAWILDAVIMGTFAVLMYTLIFLIALGSRTYSPAIMFFIILFITAPSLLYPFICEKYFKGQTIGKRVMNIRVVNLDGSRPTTGQLLLRWLLLLVDGVMLGSSVGLLSIIFTRNSQRLGDLAAGTTVVRTRDYTSTNIRLYDFNYNDPNYRPFYREAVNLTWRQVETIANVLHSYQVSNRRDSLIPALAQKVQDILGVRPVMPPAQFLQTIVNDYYYYDVKK